MNIVIIGICGKMGTLIHEYLKKSHNVVGIDICQHSCVSVYSNLNQINDIDLVIDFSSITGMVHLEDSIKRKIPVFSGTTNYSEKDISYLEKLAEEHGSIFVWKPNYAKGINDLLDLISHILPNYHKWDLIEIHSSSKKDLPSGTAKLIKRYLKDDKEIQSIRLENSNPIHKIIFYGEDEKIIISHEILNKNAFIKGLFEEIKKYGVDVNVRNII